MNEFYEFLLKNPFNLLLFGTAIVSGTMLLWPLVGWTRRGTQVSVLEAVQLINRRDATVLDVRDAGEFGAGHVVSARHIPESQVADRMKELEKFKARPVIVACRSGSRGAVIADTLRRQGFEEAVALQGGMAAWVQAGMPVEKK